MKRRILLFICISAIYTALAQDNIDLLMMIKEDSVQTIEVSPEVPMQPYDWQTQRHSFTLSYGSPSIIDKALTGFAWLVMLGTEDSPQYTGCFSLQYGYNVLRWLRVGGRYSYAGYKTKYNEWLHLNYIAARVDFTYLNKKHLKLYSGFETGIGICHDSYGYEPTTFPFLITSVCPIGIHAGGEHAYFMSEINFGNTELVRVGVGFHF